MSRSLRDGFTIVEVMVVTVIMVILLGLTVVNMVGQQSVARDNERKTDAENIARGLERYYNDPSLGNGKYPDLTLAATIVSANRLPGVETANYYFTFNNNTLAFAVASGITGTTAVTDTSATGQLTANNIIYLPMMYSTANSRWEACDSGEECTRYVLHYQSEASGTVTLKSRRQQ